MGTYLSTPVVEKGEESGESLSCALTPLSWGVVDMQGWRKTMEDAHVACTDVEVPQHLRGEDLENLGYKAKVFGVFDGHGGAEVARFCQLYLVDVLTSMPAWKENDRLPPRNDAVGGALIGAFHALDIMIDDPDRREELIRLRTQKPSPGERRVAALHLPASFQMAYKSTPASANPVNSNNCSGNEKDTPTEDFIKSGLKDPETPQPQAMDEKLGTAESTVIVSDSVEDEGKSASEGETSVDQGKTDATTSVGHHAEEDHATNGTDEVKDRALSIVSSNQEVLEQVVDIGGGEQLSISGNASGHVEMTFQEEEDVEQEASKTDIATAALPTIYHNGRQICNLPDHPIHAGCTAVVAVLIGRTLTVANAGDSRAVLCREGGLVEPLSFDHKPLQDREMQRIARAGGFVNQFGRVNGNLNLSRSIGDLKYKQVPGLSPAEQMITAEPDVVQVRVQPKDEFIVLGCDGIWDCLTNEQAVQYVRERVDSKTPTEIGAEMLDNIISDDPRATQGIGGDNMTIMIIDLQPQTRGYR